VQHNTHYSPNAIQSLTSKYCEKKEKNQNCCKQYEKMMRNMKNKQQKNLQACSTMKNQMVDLTQNSKQINACTKNNTVSRQDYCRLL